MNFNFQPLEQFNIVTIFYLKSIPFTNLTVYNIIVILFFCFFFWLVSRDMRVVPRAWQIIGESYYKFLLNLTKQQMGWIGRRFFPLTFTLFTFILTSNLMGMTLYGFTTTSHIAVTFCLSFSLFLGIIILGFQRQGLHFFHLFVPAGAPKPMLPFLVIIEVISFVSRPFSLGIRLFANMMSGHTLLVILSGFTLTILQLQVVLGFLPITLITCIIGLELFIAALQAYVFTVLVCIYMKESVYGH